MLDSFISLFTNPGPTSFINFSFLPKYAVYFVQGVEYTLLLSITAVLLAIIPALLLALMVCPAHILRSSVLLLSWFSFPSSFLGFLAL